MIHYIASGAQSFPKERIEIVFDGKTIAIDNWRKLKRYGVSGPLFERSHKMDKGHAAELHAWISAVRTGGPAPISFKTQPRIHGRTRGKSNRSMKHHATTTLTLTAREPARPTGVLRHAHQTANAESACPNAAN